ncbi:hypothetical protein [Paraglaciecola sp. 25GB23A]|uniref:hypothetical protein n=1 Tax=Paraglaciecola sp. 25GB23A TaxID=3156068 RepID=UPI0032AF9E26
MNLRTLFLILSTFSLSGCLITEWEDVSGEDEYKQIIGVQLKTKVAFDLHGVTMEPNYEKVLHQYALMESPGFSGPEVLSKANIPVGTLFNLVKVIRCVDCIFKKEKLVLEFTSSDKYKDAPITYSYDRYLKMQKEYFE